MQSRPGVSAISMRKTFTMIGAYNNQGIIINALSFQPVNKLSNMTVDISNRLVITTNKFIRKSFVCSCFVTPRWCRIITSSVATARVKSADKRLWSAVRRVGRIKMHPRKKRPVRFSLCNHSPQSRQSPFRIKMARLLVDPGINKKFINRLIK